MPVQRHDERRFSVDDRLRRRVREGHEVRSSRKRSSALLHQVNKFEITFQFRHRQKDCLEIKVFKN